MSVGDAFDDSLRAVCVTLLFALDLSSGISSVVLPNRLISRLPSSSACARKEKAVSAVKLRPLISKYALEFHFLWRGFSRLRCG